MTGPTADDARLNLATEGPLLWLLVSAPELPQDRGTIQLDVQVDGGPVHHMSVLATSNTAGLSLGGAMAHDIAAASRITVTFQGRTWKFVVHNIRAAIDAVASCAGEPTLAERDVAVPKPIAGAGQWKLQDHLPGAPGSCSARLVGREVDTMLLPGGQDGSFVLIAGRPDWAAWSGEGDIELAVDGGAATRLKANALQNLLW
jgi:hypothetical protein